MRREREGTFLVGDMFDIRNRLTSAADASRTSDTFRKVLSLDRVSLTDAHSARKRDSSHLVVLDNRTMRDGALEQIGNVPPPRATFSTTYGIVKYADWQDRTLRRFASRVAGPSYRDAKNRLPQAAGTPVFE